MEEDIKYTRSTLRRKIKHMDQTELLERQTNLLLMRQKGKLVSSNMGNPYHKNIRLYMKLIRYELNLIERALKKARGK